MSKLEKKFTFQDSVRTLQMLVIYQFFCPENNLSWKAETRHIGTAC